MTKLFNEDGEPVETLSNEELEELQAKAAKTEELEAALKEKEEALAKYSDKEFNFKQFREAEAAKREEMMAGFSEKEKIRIMEIEELHKRADEADQRYFGGAKESVLTKLVGADPDNRQKLEELTKEMYPNGLPRTEEGIETAYRRAAIILQSEQGVNPLNSFSPSSPVFDNPSEKKRFTDTPDGKAILEQKFAKEIEKAKSKGFTL